MMIEFLMIFDPSFQKKNAVYSVLFYVYSTAAERAFDEFDQLLPHQSIIL